MVGKHQQVHRDTAPWVSDGAYSGTQKPDQLHTLHRIDPHAGTLMLVNLQQRPRSVNVFHDNQGPGHTQGRPDRLKDLSLIASVTDAQEWHNRIVYLPLS